MDLQGALENCRSLSDCPRLVEALGGEPRFIPLPPELLARRTRNDAEQTQAAEVGRFGALPCIAIATQVPERSAARLARSMMMRGEPCLVIGVAASGILALGVGAEPPSVLTLDTGRPDSTALASLKRLRHLTGGGRVGAALRFAEALGGQRADRRFFESFRRIRDRFAEEGPAGAPMTDRRALALLHLTRVLFLYFIQQKGWLDGRDDFLTSAVDDHLARGRPVDRDLLRPLFFGTLNRPEASRGLPVKRFGRIPFLNGGLFEPHLLERRWSLARSNASWRAAFDEVFERFHFTLSDEGDVGTIAPDMLGRVFEGLMAADERHATGTYYTPSRLVASIVSSAFTSLLAERLAVGSDHAAALIDARDPAAGQVLSRIRLLDPAAGSGAFLLGALERLAALTDVRGPADGPRRRILRSQLFGVDLSAEAVRIAELRLWLAAVQGDPDGPEFEVEPLPNLDATLRQGDALQDPRWLTGHRRVPARSARALAEARRLFAGESGPGKRTAWRTLQGAERAAARESLELVRAGLDRRIEMILVDARAPDLFGVRRGLDRELRVRLAEAREDRRRACESARRLAREGALPWFDAPSAFAEVFAQSGGFDLVIGNPPWVRGELIPPRTREALASRYHWWRGGGGPFSHRPDLSVAFLERALELTAPGGVLSMLVPAKLATASYAGALRAGLSTQTSVDRLVDLTDDEGATFGAVTYPMVISVRKRPPLADQSVATALTGAGTLPQASLGAAPWVLKAPDAAKVAAMVRKTGLRFGEQFPIHLGVKSGCNAAFLRPTSRVEPDLVRIAVRGRDLAPYRIKAGTPMLYPHDRLGRPIKALPAGASRHLAPFRAALERRTDAGTGPWWALRRTGPASAPHRVAWADLARRLGAVPLPAGVVPLNSCYFAITPTADAMLAVATWLNSTWCRAVVRLGANPARGGFGRFNASTVGAAPWMAAAATDRTLIALGRDAAAGKEAADAIDRLVAQHLGLDARDRRALSTVA